MPNWNNLTEPRVGLLIHYSAGSYVGSVAWCRDPVSKVSYNWIVSQAGDSEVIAPWDKRAWHAGVCKSRSPQLKFKDGNSAFEGLALAASDGDTISPDAFAVLVEMCQARFDANGWDRSETWRIVGHNEVCHPKGRKSDPVGSDPANPVIDLELLRLAVNA